MRRYLSNPLFLLLFLMGIILTAIFTFFVYRFEREEGKKIFREREREFHMVRNGIEKRLEEIEVFILWERDEIEGILSKISTKGLRRKLIRYKPTPYGWITLDEYYRSNPGAYSNLFYPEGVKLTPEVKEFLILSEGIDRFFRMAEEIYGDFVKRQYFVTRNFLRVYPFLPVSQFPLSPDMKLHYLPEFQAVSPEKNPGRKIVWISSGGREREFKLIAPVYKGDKFKGALYLSLDFKRIISPIEDLDFPIAILDGEKRLLYRSGEFSYEDEIFESRISPTDWIIISPKPAFGNFSLPILIFSAVFSFFLLVGIFLTRRENRFIGEMERALKKWLSGDLDFTLVSYNYPPLSKLYEGVERLSLLLKKERKEREKSAEEIVASLVSAAEARDPYAQGHSRRVAIYTEEIAKELHIPRDRIKKLRYAALLHDIGKIAIPDLILLNPGKLTHREWEILMQYPIMGERIVESMPIISDISHWIRSIHEKYDGTGYPDGLSGDNIPLESRIISVAEAIDAMRNERPYRRALSVDEISSELRKGRGAQWDPLIVDAALKVIRRIQMEEIKDPFFYEMDRLRKREVLDWLKELTKLPHWGLS
jgi:HD-GYP domain-containing protein (c-di-GMP phosphodiesterase class II)